MRRIIFACLFAVYVLSGCSAVTVRQEAAPAADFTNLKSYCWLDEDGASGNIRAKNPKVEELVVSSVDRQLKKKGYAQTSEENADFFITWFGKVDEKVAQQSISHFYKSYGYGTLAGAHPELVEQGGAAKAYTKGTLILDVLDAKSRDIIWRGSATDTIVEGMSDADVAAYIKRSVNRLLSTFPAR